MLLTRLVNFLDKICVIMSENYRKKKKKKKKHYKGERESWENELTDNQSASKQIHQTRKTQQILALCLCFTFSTKCNVMCCKASKTHHLPLITPSLLLLPFFLSLLSSPHHSINSQHLQPTATKTKTYFQYCHMSIYSLVQTQHSHKPFVVVFGARKLLHSLDLRLTFAFHTTQITKSSLFWLYNLKFLSLSTGFGFGFGFGFLLFTWVVFLAWDLGGCVERVAKIWTLKVSAWTICFSFVVVVL